QPIQKMRVTLNLPTAVWENEVVGAAQGFEHVLGDCQRCTLRFQIVLAARSVRGCELFKPFDQDEQLAPSRCHIDHCHCAVRPQKLGRQTHVAQRSGETNARHGTSQCDFYTVHQRLQLLPAFGTDECMKLIDDEEGHVLE